VGTFAAVVRENRQQDFYCVPITYYETSRIKLPDGKTLANLPKGEAVSRPLGEYQSSYQIDGNVLVASRKIVWRTPSSVCTRKMADDLSPVWQAIERDTSLRLNFANASNGNSPERAVPAEAVSAQDNN